MQASPLTFGGVYNVQEVYRNGRLVTDPLSRAATIKEAHDPLEGRINLRRQLPEDDREGQPDIFVTSQDATEADRRVTSGDESDTRVYNDYKARAMPARLSVKEDDTGTKLPTFTLRKLPS